MCMSVQVYRCCTACLLATIFFILPSLMLCILCILYMCTVYVCTSVMVLYSLLAGLLLYIFYSCVVMLAGHCVLPRVVELSVVSVFLVTSRMLCILCLLCIFVLCMSVQVSLCCTACLQVTSHILFVCVPCIYNIIIHVYFELGYNTRNISSMSYSRPYWYFLKSELFRKHCYYYKVSLV